MITKVNLLARSKWLISHIRYSDQACIPCSRYWPPVVVVVKGKRQELIRSSKALGYKPSPVARENSEICRALHRCCYPHAGNGVLSLCLSSSLSLSARFSIENEAMDVALPAPQAVMYILP